MGSVNVYQWCRQLQCIFRASICGNFGTGPSNCFFRAVITNVSLRLSLFGEHLEKKINWCFDIPGSGWKPLGMGNGSGTTADTDSLWNWGMVHQQSIGSHSIPHPTLSHYKHAINPYWLVVLTILKNISQWKGLSLIIPYIMFFFLKKKKTYPNHQLVPSTSINSLVNHRFPHRFPPCPRSAQWATPSAAPAPQASWAAEAARHAATPAVKGDTRRIYYRIYIIIYIIVYIYI